MKRLDRRKAVAALLQNRGDLLVVSGLGSATYDVAAAGDDDKNIYLWGAMGAAAMIGFGLAVAQPKRPVMVITGDGEMLMGFGALATIGLQPPPNLTIAVIDNGYFGETGMQKSHTGYGLSLPDIAATCGLEWSKEIVDMAGVEDLRGRAHACRGVSFAAIQVLSDELPRVLPIRDGTLIKHRFISAIGVQTQART